MYSVIIHGVCGHMGRVVADICREDPYIEIAAGIDAMGGEAPDFPIYKELASCTEHADAIIDFSTAAAVDELLAYGTERGIPMVICTTGLSETQTGSIREASEQVAILRSGNMSIGINLLMKLVRQASAALVPNGFDPEIVEMHHRRKLDAPSGTALMLAESINEAQEGRMHVVTDRSQRREQRDPNEIGISAVRGGTIVGEHSVMFAGQDEMIEIRHSAYSRAIFAKGAVSAAKFLAGRKPGLYDMSDVIDEM